MFAAPFPDPPTTKLLLPSEDVSKGGAGVGCLEAGTQTTTQTDLMFSTPSPQSSLLASGFFFRQKTYSEVERVLDAFKRDPNYKKKQVAQGQQRMGGPPGPAGARAGTSYACSVGFYAHKTSVAPQCLHTYGLCHLQEICLCSSVLWRTRA